jgi:hypothetical protein
VAADGVRSVECGSDGGEASPTGSVCLTHNTQKGLRTLSGGQYTIQIEGYLAIDESAAPPLVIEAPHSVGQVYAVLGRAADAVVALQLNVNGSAYCALTFDAFSAVSNAVDGCTLPPLTQGAQVTLSVVSVGQASPGADLAVLITL